MSELGAIKSLDGHPACFIRFEGADKFIVPANGVLQTVTREHWRSLPIHR